MHLMYRIFVVYTCNARASNVRLICHLTFNLQKLNRFAAAKGGKPNQLFRVQPMSCYSCDYFLEKCTRKCLVIVHNFDLLTVLFSLMCVRFSTDVLANSFVNYSYFFCVRIKESAYFFHNCAIHEMCIKRTGKTSDLIICEKILEKHKKSIIPFRFCAMFRIKSLDILNVRCIYIWELRQFVNEEEKKKSKVERWNVLCYMPQNIRWLQCFNLFSIKKSGQRLKQHRSHTHLLMTSSHRIIAASRHATECIVSNKLWECATLT